MRSRLGVNRNTNRNTPSPFCCACSPLFHMIWRDWRNTKTFDCNGHILYFSLSYAHTHTHIHRNAHVEKKRKHTHTESDCIWQLTRYVQKIKDSQTIQCFIKKIDQKKTKSMFNLSFSHPSTTVTLLFGSTFHSKPDSLQKPSSLFLQMRMDQFICVVTNSSRSF